MEGNELTVVPQGPADLAVAREPEIILQEARRAAQALGDVIGKKSKPVMFNGEQYLEFEDWQTVGQFYGYTVRTHDAEPVEIEGVKGAKAKADLLDRHGCIVGGAESYCMRDEKNWSTRPTYEWIKGIKTKTGDIPVPFFQLASMAQTRSGAKALRNRLSWVVVLAGYKPTPAEEIDHQINQPEAVSQHRDPVQEIFQASGPVKEIKAWLFAMNKGDSEKMETQLKELTKWKAKETGEEKWLDIKSLDNIASKKPDWFKRIHAKVAGAYEAHAGSAQL